MLDSHLAHCNLSMSWPICILIVENDRLAELGGIVMQLMHHPWLQAKLPKELDMLNYHLIQMQLPAGLQSVKEIEVIVSEADHIEGEPRYELFPWDK